MANIQQHKNITMVSNSNCLNKAEASIPELHHNVIEPKNIIIVKKNKKNFMGYSSVSIGDISTFYSMVLKPNDEIILDFGNHYVGYLSFDCIPVGSPPDAPAHLDFIFGETLHEISEPFSKYKGWISSSWLQQQSCYLDELPVNVALPRRYCCRYIKIKIVALSSKFNICFKKLCFDSVTSASLVNLSPCVSKDPLLCKIDAIGLRTLVNCMQEIFEDGPKRDRRLWLGDLRLQALVNDVTIKNNSLVKRCLYLFATMTRQDGMLSANVFVKPTIIADDTFLFDYALFFVDVLYNYVVTTNDEETLQDLWPIAWRQIELALNRVDKNGILKDSSDWWAFIDWQELLNKQASAQGVLIYCLHKAQELAKRVDNNKLHSLELQIARLKKATLQELWDDKLGFFVSGKKRQVSYASQVWLVLADVGDLKFQQTLMQNLDKDHPAITMSTPYMMHHYIEALLKVGDRSRAITEIKRYWGAMVEHGADTFWEVFDPEHSDFSPYGNKLINSYCHAWSCTPTWFIRKFNL